MTNPVTAANEFVIARVREEFTRWCQEMPSVLDEQRVQAVRAVLATAFEANPQTAARTWTFFRHVLSQRSGFDAVLLRRADACATDGYLAFGVKALAPPIVCLDLIDTPLSYMRSAVRAKTRALPIPVAFIPPHYLSCPWLLTTLHHEVGHALERDLAISAALDAAFASLDHVSDHARSTWRRWFVEIICDAFAVRLTGPAYAWSLATVLDQQEQWDEWNDTSVHPPAAVRIPLLAAMARILGSKTDLLSPLLDRARRGLEGYAGLPRELVTQAEAIAALVLTTNIPALGRSIADAGPMTRDDTSLIEGAVAALVERRPPPGAFPIRLAPAAAQIAILQSPCADTAAAIDHLVRDAMVPRWEETGEAPSEVGDKQRLAPAGAAITARSPGLRDEASS
ncbi:MAG TPA: hypothetical protein VHN14_30890 [Kofleriaceae bacterium]|jgi:hypothetical protein|nr:hypothetical protein [Kofleriaceae bacterium]